MNNYEIQSCLMNDEPIPFKGLLIYPFTMKQYYLFHQLASILTIEKNKIPDPKIISKSYLDFLIDIIKVGDELSQSTSTMLYSLLSLALHDDNMLLKHGIENKKTYLSINDVKIFKRDFDDLKELILIQNIPDYKNDYIDPELEEELNKVRQMKNNGEHCCNVEKQLVSIAMGMSMSLEEVKNMTIRKFYIALDMIDRKLHYIIKKTASMSGMVEFKNDIKHYLVEDSNDLNNSVVDYQQFQNKINSAN